MHPRNEHRQPVPNQHPDADEETSSDEEELPEGTEPSRDRDITGGDTRTDETPAAEPPD